MEHQQVNEELVAVEERSTAKSASTTIPTVGLLLRATRNERTVRYALARSASPMAVAGYRYSELSAAEQAVLPAEAAIVDAVSAALDCFDPAAAES